MKFTANGPFGTKFWLRGLLLLATMLLAWKSMSQITDRVALARQHKGAVVAKLLKDAKLPNPCPSIFFRAFKMEGILEIWGSAKGGEYRLIQTYTVAKQSGIAGPKRQEGDGQVPEGVYTINRFNPKSSFYLSLGLDYPNASDLIRTANKEAPGSDIFIHGNSVSIGCLAMTDPIIEEIYLLALMGKAKGIPVHIFPARMKGPRYAELREANSAHLGFWDELQPIYLAFEKTRRVPKVRVTPSGAYQIVGS
jgi:murein L,D-transpeptidase YafK